MSVHVYSTVGKVVIISLVHYVIILYYDIIYSSANFKIEHSFQTCTVQSGLAIERRSFNLVHMPTLKYVLRGGNTCERAVQHHCKYFDFT